MHFHANDPDDLDECSEQASESPAQSEVDSGVLFDEADLAGFKGIVELDESRYTDLLLETPLGVDALQKRLLQLARDARTAEEEQGINILYLALGFLRWYESPNSQVMREAPLILIPAELVRNERTSTYDLNARPDDLSTNLPLKARLKEDFGIHLPEVEIDEQWKPSAYFSEARAATSSKERWSIDENGMQLGFFSFARELLQRDLEQEKWPPGGLAEDSTIESLLVGGFKAVPPLFSDREPLDRRLAPNDLVQVINADAPQTKAIQEVRCGRNLVVQGPPGTGKSQTITNIIASAVHDGKTVLFMAEKMAALNVVHDRLKQCGLEDLCLELHSRRANRRDVLKEIGRTLKRAREDSPQAPDTDALRRARDELNRIADILHTKLDDLEFSPFEALSDLIGHMGDGQPTPQIPLKGLEALGESTEKDIVELVKFIKRAGARKEHPFYGTGDLDLDPLDLQRLRAMLEESVSILDEAISVSEPIDLLLANETQVSKLRLRDMDDAGSALAALRDAPNGADALLNSLFGHDHLDSIAKALELGETWRQVRQEAEKDFRDHAFEVPAAPLQIELTRGESSFWARLSSAYRAASKTLAGLLRGPLPKSTSERLVLAEQLFEVQRLRRDLGNEEGLLAASLAMHWRGERTEFISLLDVVRWTQTLQSNGILRHPQDIEHLRNSFPDLNQAALSITAATTSVRDAIRPVIARLKLDGNVEADDLRLILLRNRFSNMVDCLPRYEEWCAMERVRDRLRTSGLDTLLALIDEQSLAPDDALSEFCYARAEARWKLARASRPELEDLSRFDRHELVLSFSEQLGTREDDVRRLIREQHLAQVPRGAAGEMGIIRGEIARKRRHMPIRKLVSQAGLMLTRIKPVFLMSPVSIAQFLPPGALSFDLLVIDEASQVRPEDALGAIARCKQMVIVGDQKQLPPTSFFDRLADDSGLEDEEEFTAFGAAATEMESVLTLCEARGMNQRMLEWHYRSRDPSLIRISNAEFYEDRLILPPSPLELDENFGLSFTRVPGVYASAGSCGFGRPGTNRIEAEYLVRAVSEHARRDPTLSLGIATFSNAQADMVTEILEFERRRDEELNDFLAEGRREDVFVKNIENVQGDERDVIFVSVGYGPQEPNGRLTSMRFGPVNAEGGERRLNVLFTRARARCRVFASFDPGDIDLSRTSGEGPRVLKRFLDFAQSGEANEHRSTGEGADSPFEEDVAKAIRSLGYIADHQVGSGGFRIDLGVRHADCPGRYLLAVECDGARYHSALSARERDRHRQIVLEGLGWKFHRIWSTDWFRRRSQEIERLQSALDDARSLRTVSVAGANTRPREVTDEDEFSMEEIQAPTTDSPMPSLRLDPYRIAHATRIGPDFSYLTGAQMEETVRQIVAQEGPLHEKLVARRVAEAWGISRTARLEAKTRSALGRANGEIFCEGPFWMLGTHSENPPKRDRTEAESETRKAEMLPPIEVRAAADLVEKECGRLQPNDLVQQVARLMGFKRVGSELRPVLENILIRNK